MMSSVPTPPAAATGNATALLSPSSEFLSPATVAQNDAMASLRGATAQQEAWARAMARPTPPAPTVGSDAAHLRRLATQNAELQSQLAYAAVAGAARDRNGERFVDVYGDAPLEEAVGTVRE